MQKKYAVLTKDENNNRVVMAINRDAETALALFQSAKPGEAMLLEHDGSESEYWIEFKIVARQSGKR